MKLGLYFDNFLSKLTWPRLFGDNVSEDECFALDKHYGWDSIHFWRGKLTLLSIFENPLQRFVGDQNKQYFLAFGVPSFIPTSQIPR